jgi:hypothetical protein
MSTDATDEPTDEEVVRTAAEAAEGYLLAQYKQSDIRDLDVTVTFEDGVLDVDVYLNVPDDVEGPPAEDAADAAALTARDAVDELFAEADG